MNPEDCYRKPGTPRAALCEHHQPDTGPEPPDYSRGQSGGSTPTAPREAPAQRDKERPRHALNLDTPIQKYTPSERLYPEKISQWEYPEDCKIRRVRGNGFFTCEGQGCFLSEVFDGMIHRNCICHF